MTPLQDIKVQRTPSSIHHNVQYHVIKLGHSRQYSLTVRILPPAQAVIIRAQLPGTGNVDQIFPDNEFTPTSPHGQLRVVIILRGQFIILTCEISPSSCLSVAGSSLLTPYSAPGWPYCSVRDNTLLIALTDKETTDKPHCTR